MVRIQMPFIVSRWAISLSLLGILTLLGLCQIDTLAQPPRVGATAPRAAASASPTGTPKKRTVRFIGKEQRYTERTGIHDLRGDVKFTSEDTVLTTDYATYSEKTKIASSPGPLRIEDSLNTVTGNAGTAYYTTRDIKLRGNVVIVARPRPENLNAPEGSSRRQFDSPATITCEVVDYNWGTRVADLSGNLKIVQKDRVVTADKARYEARLERVTLEGNVYYTNAKGEKFRADRAVFIMKEGEEDFQGSNVTGEFEVEDELDDPAPGTPSPTGEPVPGKPVPSEPAPANKPNPNPIPPASPTPTPSTTPTSGDRA